MDVANKEMHSLKVQLSSCLAHTRFKDRTAVLAGGALQPGRVLPVVLFQSLNSGLVDARGMTPALLWF